MLALWLGLKRASTMLQAHLAAANTHFDYLWICEEWILDTSVAMLFLRVKIDTVARVCRLDASHNCFLVISVCHCQMSVNRGDEFALYQSVKTFTQQ